MIKDSTWFLFVLIYLFGSFFGDSLIPFVYFENLSDVQLPYHLNVWVWLFAFIITFFFILIGCGTIYIVSNKKIQIITAYKMCDRMLKKHCFYFEDIVNVSFDNYYFLSNIELTFKDGANFHLTKAFVNFKKAKTIIEKNIASL